ncbi:ALP1-like protein [Tanacetum coccineum]
MSSPHKPSPKPSRVAKISVRHTWRKKLNHCNSSHEADVNLPTPMPKLQSPINEPTTHSNHVLPQSHSLPLSDSCDTNAYQAAYEASKPKVQRTPIERDRYGAYDCLVMAYFSEHPQYDEATFRERFRMSRRLFTKIVREVTDASHFSQQRDDCTGQRGISSLMKCTYAIRQLAYGSVPDSLDEYLQMGATTARKSLQIFCKAIMNLYGEEFLRKPTYTDMEKLYAYHEEKHGFPWMLGSIDCTHWLWANSLVAYRAQFYRGDHGPDPFILLEAIASNDLWIWHAFFGVSGMNNDVNVLRQSPIFNDLKSGRAPEVPFVANSVLYKRGYYIIDGIYPQWSVLIKSIKNPEEQHRDDDPVRTHEESMQVTQEIVDRTGHLSLKADLVERIWNNAN